MSVKSLHLSTKKQNILSRLIDEANKSSMLSMHSAGIIKNGKLIITGINSRRVCINGKWVNSIHAEIAVMMRYLKKRDTIDGDIWVIRVNRTGNLCDSTPCSSCIMTMKRYGVKKIWYSSSNGELLSMKIDDISAYKTRWQRNNGVDNNLTLK